MAKSDARKREIEQLRRAIEAGDHAAASELLRAAGGAAGRPRRPVPPGTASAPIPLEKACGGSSVAVPTPTPAGEMCCWRIRCPPAEVSPECAGLARQYAAVLRGAGQRFDDDAALDASPALCHVADGSPADPLLVCAAGCGPAGTPVFLISTMRHDGEAFAFEQHLARDYREEPAVLAAFAERYADARVIVTFRRRASVVKRIAERCAHHGVTLPRRKPPVLDLRKEARSRWGEELASSSLEAVERCLCGRQRTRRVARPEVPDVYHHFVRTGDARLLGAVVRDARLDLLTMAQVLVAVLTGRGPVVE